VLDCSGLPECSAPALLIDINVTVSKPEHHCLAQSTGVTEPRRPMLCDRGVGDVDRVSRSARPPPADRAGAAATAVEFPKKFPKRTRRRHVMSMLCDRGVGDGPRTSPDQTGHETETDAT
jgi:hypothetical protein